MERKLPLAALIAMGVFLSPQDVAPANLAKNAKPRVEQADASQRTGKDTQDVSAVSSDKPRGEVVLGDDVRITVKGAFELYDGALDEVYARVTNGGKFDYSQFPKGWRPQPYEWDPESLGQMQGPLGPPCEVEPTFCEPAEEEIPLPEPEEEKPKNRPESENTPSVPEPVEVIPVLPIADGEENEDMLIVVGAEVAESSFGGLFFLDSIEDRGHRVIFEIENPVFRCPEYDLSPEQTARFMKEWASVGSLLIAIQNAVDKDGSVPYQLVEDFFERQKPGSYFELVDLDGLPITGLDV